MNTTEKQNKPAAEKEKKQLTPQQIQKRKKMVIFPLLFLLFTASMWLIFAPSGEDKEQQQEGFNTELPTPKQNGIVGDNRRLHAGSHAE